MLSYFTISAEYDEKDIYTWADGICREFLEELEDAVEPYGYEVITRGDSGTGDERETITDSPEFASLKKTYYCDFRFSRPEEQVQSMWYRIQISGKKAILGVINLLTIKKITNRDFRGLVINSKGRTDFLSYYSVKEQTDPSKPPAPKKEKAKVKEVSEYHFKICVTEDIIAVWCAVDENPDKPDREDTFRLYANILSCVRMRHTNLAIPTVFMCNGCMPGVVQECAVDSPSVDKKNRESRVQIGRLLLAASNSGMFDWLGKYVILIPNFTDYTAQDFEIEFETEFSIFCAGKNIALADIATFGYLDSIAGTKKQLAAIIEDWG